MERPVYASTTPHHAAGGHFGAGAAVAGAGVVAGGAAAGAYYAGNKGGQYHHQQRRDSGGRRHSELLLCCCYWWLNGAVLYCSETSDCVTCLVCLVCFPLMILSIAGFKCCCKPCSDCVEEHGGCWVRSFAHPMSRVGHAVLISRCLCCMYCATAPVYVRLGLRRLTRAQWTLVPLLFSLSPVAFSSLLILSVFSRLRRVMCCSVVDLFASSLWC